MPDAATVPDRDQLIHLRVGSDEVIVAPTAGGRIAQVIADGQPLLVDVPRSPAHPTGWGSFPMAPWAGRIRAGRFNFDGSDHQLGLNHVDGEGGPGRTHSIHGTVFTRPWALADLDGGSREESPGASLTMSCDLAGELGWPFDGTAHQRITVGDGCVTCELWIDTTTGRFPAELGWHPWFRRPDRLEFSPTAMYRRDATGLPTGELIDPVPGPWDDCFVNRAPVVLHYARTAAAAVTITSDCDHWVVYDEPADATCVEPQSGPPDAFNLAPHVVTPDAPLRRTMTIAW